MLSVRGAIFVGNLTPIRESLHWAIFQIWLSFEALAYSYSVAP
jgi:hypothetical protein